MKRLTILLLIMTISLGMAACGSNGKAPAESTQETSVEVVYKDVKVAEVRQAVADAIGDNYFPQMEIPAEFMEGFGLTADMYEEFFGEMPMISTNVDTLIVIKAKEDQVAAVEGVLNAYRENLVNDTMQYPMNLGKIQASEVKTFGKYVCFVQLGGDVMDALEKGDEEVIKHCQAENAKALEAVEAFLVQ